MPIRIVRSRDLVRTPWKNGGGTTAEILVEPPGAGFDQFDWRISMADVAMPGPFSTFFGIDRTLALIEGVSLDLDVDGVVHHLDAASPALSFRGEAATRAALPTGPIRDLNVMTRRAGFRHRMCFPKARSVFVLQSSGLLVLISVEEERVASLGLETFRLDRFDVLVANGITDPISADGGMIAVEITPA